MNIEELKQSFILDEAGMKKNLESVVLTALEYVCVDSSGNILLKNTNLPGRTRIKLALAAKSIANQLDNSFKTEVTAEELATATGLAVDQARARAAETIDEGFAESPGRGLYRARFMRIAPFLSELSKREAK